MRLYIYIYKDNYLKHLKKYAKFYDTYPEFYQLEY